MNLHIKDESDPAALCNYAVRLKYGQRRQLGIKHNSNKLPIPHKDYIDYDDLKRKRAQIKIYFMGSAKKRKELDDIAKNKTMERWLK